MTTDSKHHLSVASNILNREFSVNAPMESFWGILKTELVHHRKFKTRQQAILEITEYIDLL